MPGSSIVFRWYARAQADEIYSTWTVEQLQMRLMADHAGKSAQPLGQPGAATTDSLERLLADWQAQGYGQERISQIPAEQASDKLLRYELICDACTQAEWRAKEAFFLRHVNGLRGDIGEYSTNLPVLGPEELEEHYAASRQGRFRWQDWPALTEAMERLNWERWHDTFRASYELDKPTRRAGVEQKLREHYEAFEELRHLLEEGERQQWALVIYDANDERLPFPVPPVLDEALRQTEAEVAAARREAEAILARKRRLWRIVVPIILLLVFGLLSFLFTQSLIGGAIGTTLIFLMIAIIVYLIIRKPAGNGIPHDHH